MPDVGIFDHSCPTLPAPRGPYGVSRYDEFVRDTHPDLLRGHGTRSWRHQVWYPSAPDARARSGYLDTPFQDPAAVTRSAAAHLQVPVRTLARLPRLRTHATRNGPLSSASDCYPVIFVVPEAGGFGAMATNLMCQLASAGFIVVAFEQPHVSASTFRGSASADPRPLPELAARLAATQRPIDVSPTPFADLGAGETLTSYLAQDLSVALDRLRLMPPGARCVDERAVGVLGIGWGGTVAARAAQLDARFGSCLTLDSQMSDALVSAGLDVPSMHITRDVDTMREEDRRRGGWPARRIAEQEQSVQLTREKSAQSFLVRIPGMFHADFTDAAYWFRNPHRTPVNGPIDPEDAADHLGAYARAFFRATLQQRRPALLESVAATPRGVSFDRRDTGHPPLQRVALRESMARSA